MRPVDAMNGGSTAGGEATTGRCENAHAVRGRNQTEPASLTVCSVVGRITMPSHHHTSALLAC